MFLIPAYFKRRALQALRGHWQTAMLVSFFTALPSLLLTALQNRLLPPLNVFGKTAAEIFAPYAAVPDGTWLMLSGLRLLAWALVCVLSVGGCRYFTCRLQGGESGLAMLFSRAGLTLRILWLYLLMAVKVLLWSLLLIVPGYVASLRYSMAPYYLAEDPTLTAWQAIEKSKNAMRETKGSLFMLELSFIGWLLLSQVLSMLLDNGTGLMSIIVDLLCSVVINTYMGGAVAAFFLTVAKPEAASQLAGDPGTVMRELENSRANDEEDE